MPFLTLIFMMLISSKLVAFSSDERGRLAEYYEKDFDAKKLRAFFADPSLQKIPEVIPKNIYNRQFKRNYASFYDSYSTHLAQKFLRHWRTRLARAEKKYGVEKEAIVAIMLVETGLGNIKGRYHVPSVFASIVLGSVQQLEQLVTAKQKEENPGVDYEAKLKRKIRWARQQLRSLIELRVEQNVNVMRWRGSSSGAFGICQFIPSSYAAWGVDGDGSGYVNLFTPADAIPSVANYLKAHGWKPGLARVENRKAVFAYNHSEVYVDTILELARNLSKL